MTPEQVEIHRKKFESLCDSSFIGRFPSGTYHWSFMQERWKGYLLCAENMPEIELPDALWGDNIGDSVYLTDDVKSAIESQGYRVKSR